MKKSLTLNRISLTISILYILFWFYYFVSVGSKAGTGPGLGLLIAFLSFHFLTLIIAILFNILISFKKTNIKGLIVATIVFYSFSMLLGFIFVPHTFFSTLLQIIILFLSISKINEDDD